MINKNLKNNKGFTLVEALFAIFILTFSISTFMGVVSTNIFSARYARDEITANYLLQEVVDYIRNERDSKVFLQSENVKESWDKFSEKYFSICSEKVGGCIIDVQGDSGPINCKEYDGQNPQGSRLDPKGEIAGDSRGDIEPKIFKDGCPYFYYNPDAVGGSFYNYTFKLEGNQESNITRQIYVERNEANGDELNINVIVSWKNGGITKTKSLRTSLLKWQK